MENQLIIPTQPSRQPVLHLTIDYELFGNGAGSIDQHMLAPTERLLAYCGKHTLPVTFFIEVGELLAFRRAIQDGSADQSLRVEMGRILDQLARIHQAGHALSVHLHPQWHGAIYHQGSWRLGSSHGRLLQYGQEVFEQTLAEGAALLESVSGVRPTIFRAGMLHYDRDARVGQSLLRQGFMTDSSLVRDLVRQTRYAAIDHRGLPPPPCSFWYTLDGTAEPSGQGVLELPIWSVMTPGWRRLNPLRLYSKLVGNRKVVPLEEAYARSGAMTTLGGLWRWLRDPQPLLWDFCLLQGSQLLDLYRQALAAHAGENSPPLVLIGHTKELVDLRPLDVLRRHVAGQTGVRWATLPETANRIRAGHA